MGRRGYTDGKDMRWRAGLRAAISHDMLTHTERANEALLSNLRRAMPHASLPEIDHVAPAPGVLWWPLTNKWAFAVDDASKKAGLARTREDSDPEVVVRALIEHHVQDEWKVAVLDELVNCHMDAAVGTPPRDILKRVIAWHVQVALDPAVSEQAQALIDRGASVALTASNRAGQLWAPTTVTKAVGS